MQEEMVSCYLNTRVGDYDNILFSEEKYINTSNENKNGNAEICFHHHQQI